MKKAEQTPESIEIRKLMAERNGSQSRRQTTSRIGTRGRARRPLSATKEDVGLLVQGHNDTFKLFATLRHRIARHFGVAQCANEPDPESLLTVRPKSGLDSGARATFKALQRGEKSRAMIDEQEAAERKEAEEALKEAEGRKLLSDALGRRLTSAENELIAQVKVRIQAKDLKAYREAKAKTRREAVEARTSLVS